MKTRNVPSAILAMAITTTASQAQLFSEDFEVDPTANWSLNTSNAGNVADFFFDYSTVGIPQAPGGTGTRGLKMEANIPGTGVFSGMSASPLGQAFTGDYILRFDAWQNFNGPFPAGGNGSTQVTLAGVGAPTTQVQFPGSTFTGAGFGATGDGGSAVDYRAYNAPGGPLAPASGAYFGGTHASVQNNTDPYYAGFGGVAAPGGQLALFPQQSGITAVGTLGMAWHRWEIRKTGNDVVWSVDGLPIAQIVGASFGGDNIFFGQFDVNATSSTDPNARALLFGLIDNVEVVPEPATMAVLGLGALALVRRRRKQ